METIIKKNSKQNTHFTSPQKKIYFLFYTTVYTIIIINYYTYTLIIRWML